MKRLANRRINRLQKAIIDANLDAVIISELSHIRYLVGFTGTAAMLVVCKNASDFFTDFRYKNQSAKQVIGASIHIVERGLISDIAQFAALQQSNIRIGFESDYLTHASLVTFQGLLGKALFVPTSGMVEDLAIIKESSEIASIKRAAAISDKAFMRVLSIVKPSVREDEVAAELEYQMKMLGSEKVPFDTILASGWRAALPHGVASSKKIEKGDFVTFDFGATYEGYVSDITRTVVVGRATSRQKRVYETVLRAQMKAVNSARAGLTGKQLDSVARDLIKKAGFARYFGHGLGHGIGIVVHEGPRVSPQSDYVLQPGNVVTIEPGIYIPDWGGVRIEDDVVIGKSGCTVINKAPKELIEL
jgi:Xaa-Pro aminopeptidase